VTAEERVKELEDAMVAVQQKLSAMLIENSEQKARITSLTAALSGEKHRVKQLKEGLSFYLPGPFWDTVVQDTKADMDQGKYAEYILRVAADGEDPRGA